MDSDDAMNAVVAASGVEMCRSRVCFVGGREVSEKAGTLVLIRVEWQNSTGNHHGRLREVLVSDQP